MDLLQKEHFLSSICPHLLVSFLASLAVSSSISTSPTLIGPMQFLVMIRPLLLPSRIRHLICVASPCIPVTPMTSMTSAGMPFSSSIGYHLLQSRYFRDDLIKQLFSFSRLHYGRSCTLHTEAGCCAKL